MAEIAVVAGGKPRRWSKEDKRRIVEESHMPGVRSVDVARRHGIRPKLIQRWRRWVEAEAWAEPSGQPGFVAVAVTADSGGGGTGEAVEIVLRNGRILRVRMALAKVGLLVQALERLAR